MTAVEKKTFLEWANDVNHLAKDSEKKFHDDPSTVNGIYTRIGME